MRMAVIADDLTGASDCGGQLVHYGLDVSVLLRRLEQLPAGNKSVVFNTDSRSLPAKEAYECVKNVCEWIRNEPFDVIYKKLDSTMRGNIGQEINAVYDVFTPDFVIIAPAYIENGRQVIDGVHYVHGRKLADTEAGKDPKTPVTESDLRVLIGKQCKRPVGHLSCGDLEAGSRHVAGKLASYMADGVAYIVADSAEGAHLAGLVGIVRDLPYSVIWAGSSGLIGYLPPAYGLTRVEREFRIAAGGKPVLLVMGSVSPTGRKQLDSLLATPNAVGLELDAAKVIAGGAILEAELLRLNLEAAAAFGKGCNVALYSSARVNETRLAGERKGYTPVQISNIISGALGEFAAGLIRGHGLRHLFLTGGDTAHQVFRRLQINEFRLLSEIEHGIPLGELIGAEGMFAVTKAGNFGSESVMTKAVLKLQGG